MTTPLRGTGGRLVVPVNGNDHVIGPADAPVTLVEYGDYQCPYCGVVQPVVRELLRRRHSGVLFVFRHFPLTDVHPYAEMASEAVEAAGVRGRFWEMHEWLMGHQARLDPVVLVTGVDALGFDTRAVADEIRTHRYLDKVRADFVGGVRSGVDGTPAFFVNGERHRGGYSLGDLTAALDRAEELS